MVPIQSSQLAKCTPSYSEVYLLCPFYLVCIRCDWCGLGTARYHTMLFTSASQSSSDRRKFVLQGMDVLSMNHSGLQDCICVLEITQPSNLNPDPTNPTLVRTIPTNLGPLSNANLNFKTTSHFGNVRTNQNAPPTKNVLSFLVE